MAPPPRSASRTLTRTQVARQMAKAVPALTKTSVARLDKEMPWYAELPAEQRAWIGMIVQAGYQSFVAWYRDPTGSPPPLTAEVFGNAPRSFAGIITLQQTVAMIRVTIEVAEADLAAAVDAEHASEVRDAILRYGRELAFATADIYAHAAELRGAWDARLEALVVDSVMRGETDDALRTRASALGWVDQGLVTVVVGSAPAPHEGKDGDLFREQIVDRVRAAARSAGLTALGAVQGDRLVVIVGGLADSHKAGDLLASHFGDGAIVVGPLVTTLESAHASAAEAVAGLHASGGWRTPEQPVSSEDLLVERALAGDVTARQRLVEDVYATLNASGGELLETLTTYLDHGSAIEATGRTLFVHANTVRYRLRRVAEETGLSPLDAHQAFTLRVAIVLGRLADPAPGGTASL